MFKQYFSNKRDKCEKCVHKKKDKKKEPGALSIGRGQDAVTPLVGVVVEVAVQLALRDAFRVHGDDLHLRG